MANPVVLLCVGVVAGAGLGALVTATVINRGAMVKHDLAQESAADDVHDHSAHDHGQDGGHTNHKTIEVTSPVPTLELFIHPDGSQSRNLEIRTTNFTFDPQAVNGEHVPGHGHAHVYVNNVKIARAYGPWVHLQALPSGTHNIRVTLNANDHSYLASGYTPIEATTTLIID